MTIRSIVYTEIDRLGNNADLNHVDVSRVTYMANLFNSSKFNGNISNWDVSNVFSMEGMFRYSQFNGDISKWDVSNVKSMDLIFSYSQFNGDISLWNVSSVGSMMQMFKSSKFDGDISQWDVSNVKYMQLMFEDSKFNGDISRWNVRDDCDVSHTLTYSHYATKTNISKLHFMAKARDKSIVMHTDAEAAYAAAMPIVRSMYNDKSPSVLGAMAWEVYRASKYKGATDSYDYAAALDACDETLNA